MTTQQKFTEAVKSLAEQLEVELVIDTSYANVGTYTFSRPGQFAPMLAVPFSFDGQRGDFSSCGTDNVLGRTLRGGAFSATEGDGFDLVLERIKAIINGERAAGEDEVDRGRYRSAVAYREQRPERERLIEHARSLCGQGDPSDLEDSAEQEKFAGANDRLLAAALNQCWMNGEADDDVRTLDGRAVQIGPFVLYVGDGEHLTVDTFLSADSASLKVCELVEEFERGGED